MGVNLDEEVKITSAEIKFSFTDKTKPTADYLVKYSDGSTKKGNGVQAVDDANKYLEDLRTNPIFKEDEE